ncbi:MAG: hypothetical protein JWO97_4530 [Acidobacteria bacterium]|nr:hypothetical protein [Acidobacteriota bacterium]
MRITIEGREHTLREQLRNRLRERLHDTTQLRCAEHGGPVVAVSIHGRENGWYDTMWTTCCDELERRASAILKKRF